MQKGVWVALEMNLSGCYPLNVSLCPKIIAEYGLNVKLLINFVEHGIIGHICATTAARP